MSSILKRVQKQRAERADQALEAFEAELKKAVRRQEKEVVKALDHLINIRHTATEYLEDVQDALSNLEAQRNLIIKGLDAEITMRQKQLAETKVTRRGLFAGLIACVPVVALICAGLVITSHQKAHAASSQIIGTAHATLQDLSLAAEDMRLQNLQNAASILSNQTGGWTSGSLANGTIWILPPIGQTLNRERARKGDPGYPNHKFFWKTKEK